MRRSGEDIITTTIGELPQVRQAAIKLSKSRYHGWANVYYIDAQSKKLTCETYSDGHLYRINRDQIHFPGNTWYTTGRTKGLTILDAMVRYAQHPYIKANAIRLGGTGNYSQY